MAELTNETVQRLNKLLAQLAKEKAKEKGRKTKPTKSPGQSPEEIAEAEAKEKSSEAEKKRALEEEKRELRRRKAHAQRINDDEEYARLGQEQEANRAAIEQAAVDRDVAAKRREAAAIKRKVRTTNLTDAEVARLRELEAALDEVADAADRAAAAQEDYDDQVRAGTQAGEAWLNTALSPSSAMLRKLQKGLVMGKGGMMAFGASIMKSAAKGELFLNMGIKLMDLSLDMLKAQMDFALKQDAAIASFRKATGAGNEYNEMILGTENRLRQAGVEIEESVAAYQTLKNEVVSFTYLSKEQQSALADTSALLAEMGFSLSTQADITQTAMESMNMSVEESQQLLVDIASTARTLGVDVDKMGQEFVANKEFIVSFGKDGAEVFEELAVQAKSLGMELGTLTGVVDKFTTFDEAGKSVGRLNAILGGPFLNSIDMMNAAMEDPAEAVNMLRDSFDQAGVSMEDMGRAEKMAFASAMGMSIEDMTNMMGKSNEQLEIQRIEQEELAEQSRQTMAITEQLKKAFQGFYLNLKPFLDNVLIPMVGVLSELGSKMGEFFATSAGMKTFFTAFGAMFGAGIALAAAFAMTMMAAATASVVGAPFAAAAGVMLLKAAAMATGGAIAGAGLGAMAGSAIASKSTGGASGSMVPNEGKGLRRKGFASGGVVTGTSTAMVGEQGPELVEMPIGSRVTSAPSTASLTKAIEELTKKLNRMGSGANVAVYIGEKQVTDIVIKALGSPRGKRALGVYSN